MKITSWNFKQPTKRPSQQWSDGRASLRFSTGRGKPGAMFTSCGPTIFLEIFGPSKWWLGDRTNYWAWGLPGLVNKHFATPIEIVDLAINSMLVIFHSSVTVYQRIPHDCCGGYLWAFGLPKMQTTRPYFLPYFLQFHSFARPNEIQQCCWRCQHNRSSVWLDQFWIPILGWAYHITTYTMYPGT